MSTFNGLNKARMAIDGAKKEADNVKGAANFATTNKYAQGAKAVTGLIDKWTGGSEDYKKRLQAEAEASLPGFKEVNDTPVIGDVTKFALDIGASLGHGFNKLFGIDDEPKIYGYGKHWHHVKKYKAGIREAIEKYNENGPGVYNTRIGKVLINKKGKIYTEFKMGPSFKRFADEWKRAREYRQKLAGPERAKRRFTLSAKKYDTQTIDGTKIFLWKENGKSHMYVNDDNRNFDDVVKRIKKRVDDRARNAQDPELLSKAEKNWNARQKRLYGKITESYGDMVTRLRNR